eukprot:CAMPEP_0114578678 /NCGR_PEP_ID=MMETSP0125-20121206/3188_1 /TAXON_ID=485358 ORGANISM="Aristerostoma sp., Strain ATCC 50986" /NCGR_SAMPLE_ID=MMETSP0125 /ASSEMBLY_ACC=CAM_ASM_000245 /LENGTH=102 /DNA_ID=CAMNT_0001768929 /DNA_START=276 /DNA_END=584 /DNA_ORIENTATION=+
MDNYTKYPESFRQAMADQKQEYEQNPLTGLIGYKKYVIDNFTPLIYDDHKDAYSQCCCEGTPAFYASWVGVTTVPMPTCGSVEAAIDLFGSCDNTPGHWFLG